MKLAAGVEASGDGTSSFDGSSATDRVGATIWRDDADSCEAVWCFGCDDGPYWSALACWAWAGAWADVRARLPEKSDMTVRALAAELGERGIWVCPDTVWRFLRRSGLSVKKTLVVTEQDGHRTARSRTRWKTDQHRLDPGRLVFVDETWVKTNMTRLVGWAPRGQPLLSKVPFGHWKTLTFLAGLRCDGIVAPLVLDGPINGRAFTACVERHLVPTLRPGYASI